MHHRARKRFGQNFLHDQRVIDQIIQSINPVSGEHIVEIGPGKGALTEPLLQATGSLDVVELDRDLIPILENNLGTSGNLHIHNTDALKFDFGTLIKEKSKLRVVGNLPYNISTPLIFHLLEFSEHITDMHFMLQKEVAERICASPGGKSYGRLSVMVQIYCHADILFHVMPESFTPKPKVESAIIRLTPYNKPVVDVTDKKQFAQLVTMAFSQRRKTIRNTLRNVLTIEEIEAAGVDPKLRAENLTLIDYSNLCLKLPDN
ncbi:MAG: 16S rRNA (adenine(1518)-N(6)/adenine(1519)-N(6))-dimethyltransferase RsmA [Gammaproteobacteria bacterium]